MNPVQKADRIQRRRAILIILIASLGGFAVISLFVYYESAIHLWVVDHYEQLLGNLLMVYFVLQLLFLPVIVLAVYLMRLAKRIIKAERNPPPGYATVRDMFVLEGRRAVVQGKIMWGIAWLLLFSSLALPLYIVYVFDKLINVT